jgi:hypothetical protein
MWRKLRSRTFAPRRPAVFPHQWPLVVATVLMLAVGIALAVWALVEVSGSLHYPSVPTAVD